MGQTLIIGGGSSLSSTLIEELNLPPSFLEATHHSRSRLNVENMVSRVHELDLAEPESCNKFKKSLSESKFLNIIILTGITSGKPLEESSYELINNVFQVNAIGITYLLPSLANSLTSGGRICILGSIAAEGNSFDSAYAASKVALRSLAKSFSGRLNDGKKIFILEPSAIEDTRMVKDMDAKIKENHLIAANGALLTKTEVCKKIINILDDQSDLNYIQKIGIGNRE